MYVSTRVSDLQTLPCDVMFVYIPNTPHFVCENTINYAVNYVLMMDFNVM